MICISNNLVWERPLITSSWTSTSIERNSGSGYSVIATIAIATSNYYDPTGGATDLYRIRFYDSINFYYSEYSTPTTATPDTDVLKHTINAITVLGTLGAIGPDSSGNFTLFGMKINQNVAESIVEQAYLYTEELIGSSAIVEVSNANKVNGFVMDYSALRIIGVLNGIAITTHFNYSSGGLNIQKPVIGQMAALMDFYRQSVNRWRKLLLSRGKVATVNDLDMSVINERAPQGSGVKIVTYDQPNL